VTSGHWGGDGQPAFESTGLHAYDAAHAAPGIRFPPAGDVVALAGTRPAIEAARQLLLYGKET
jgi:hypothetical protein